MNSNEQLSLFRLEYMTTLDDLHEQIHRATNDPETSWDALSALTTEYSKTAIALQSHAWTQAPAMPRPTAEFMASLDGEPTAAQVAEFLEDQEEGGSDE